MQPRKEGKRRTNQDSEHTPPLPQDDSQEERAPDKVEKANGHSAPRPASNEDKEPDGPDFDAAVNKKSIENTEDGKARIAKFEAEAEADLKKIRDTEPDLIERGRQMAGMVTFPNLKPIAGGIMTEAKPTDPNRWAAFDALFGNGDGRPRIDTFSGRAVDHEGTLFDDHYSMVPLTRALNVMGLKGHSADQVKKAFLQWIRMEKYNSLIERLEKTVPVWDGVPRMEMSLIDLMECFDTPVNRAMGNYFWLSFVNRLYDPGCYAPITLSLIGSQTPGKSNFARIICAEIMDDPKAVPKQLDLAADWNGFLRDITGTSVIANIGEMDGYTRGNLNKIKAFIVRTVDNMHYKFEGNFDQPRAWVVIMDGNKYDGFQRDMTGNRRLYPMIVCQLDNEDDGELNWKGKYDIDIAYRLDFTWFKANFWQIVAEAKHWLAAHTEDEYIKMVDNTTDLVMAFNAAEINAGHGLVRDPVLKLFFNKALAETEMKYRSAGTAYIKGVKREVPAGVVIYADEVADVLRRMAGNMQLNADALKSALMALPGGLDGRFTGSRRGFLFKVVDADGKPSNAIGDAAVKLVRNRLLGEGWDVFD
jgi:Virulence-associated protein E